MGGTDAVDGTVICYPILAIIGIPANLMSVVILSRGRCGLAKGITRYMVTMATADLMVCLFNVTVQGIIRFHFPNSFLNYTNVCRVTAFLQKSSIELSVWSTLTFTFDRFTTICCQKLKLKYCTERTATVVLTVVGLLSFVINIPVFFRYEPYYIVGHIDWGCRTVKGYGSYPAWLAYQWVSKLSVPLLPFPLLLLLNSFTARHIIVASRARRALKSRSNGEKSSDPEMKNRRTSIILLFTISGSFFVLWSPAVTLHIYLDLQQSTVIQGQSSLYLAIRITLLLLYSSTCTNTMIYALTQRRFREEIKNIVMYPFTLIVKLFKRLK